VNHTERKNKENTARAAESNEKKENKTYFWHITNIWPTPAQKRALAALFQMKKSKLKA